MSFIRWKIFIDFWPSCSHLSCNASVPQADPEFFFWREWGRLNLRLYIICVWFYKI